MRGLIVATFFIAGVLGSIAVSSLPAAATGYSYYAIEQNITYQQCKNMRTYYFRTYQRHRKAYMDDKIDKSLDMVHHIDDRSVDIIGTCEAISDNRTRVRFIVIFDGNDNQNFASQLKEDAKEFIKIYALSSRILNYRD